MLASAGSAPAAPTGPRFKTSGLGVVTNAPFVYIGCVPTSISRFGTLATGVPGVIVAVTAALVVPMFSTCIGWIICSMESGTILFTINGPKFPPVSENGNHVIGVSSSEYFDANVAVVRLLPVLLRVSWKYAHVPALAIHASRPTVS